jgi:hypothetical protein
VDSVLRADPQAPPAPAESLSHSRFGSYWNETANGFETDTFQVGMKSNVSKRTTLPEIPDGTVAAKFLQVQVEDVSVAPA